MANTLRGFFCIFLIAGLVAVCLELSQAQAQDLKVELFFDGSSDPRLRGTAFGSEPVTDSQGRLLVGSIERCEPGFCRLRVNAITSEGELAWQTRELGLSNFLAGPLLLGPADRVYIAPWYETVHAVDSSGEPVTGWPVSVVIGGRQSLLADHGVVVDSRDGTVYVKASTEGPPAATGVVALNPNGSEKWRREYRDGADRTPLVQGPARDIYTYMANPGLVVLNHSTGNEFCRSPRRGGGLVGGLEGVFTSYRSDVTAYDASCRSTGIFSWRNDIGIFGFDQGRIFTWGQEGLLAVNKAGAFLWRNPRISPESGFVNPIRAIKNNMLYVIGRDAADGNRQKLFLVHAASGRILYAIETVGRCESCGVAVADDGTIYLSDHNSTKIYKIDGPDGVPLPDTIVVLFTGYQLPPRGVLGMETLLEKISSHPALTRTIGGVFPWNPSQPNSPLEFVKETLRQTKANVVIVGHSYGGNRARLFAEQLWQEGIPVAALVPIDAIDWGVCGEVDMIAALTAGLACQLPSAACTQSGFIRSFPDGTALVATFAQEYSRLRCIRGYHIQDESFTYIYDDVWHTGIDDDARVHSVVLDILGELATVMPGSQAKEKGVK